MRTLVALATLAAALPLTGCGGGITATPSGGGGNTAPRYTITDLGIAAHDGIYGAVVNARSQVALTFVPDGDYRMQVAVWQDGTLQQLHGAPGDRFDINGTNDSGLVAGMSGSLTAANDSATVWSGNGATILQPLTGYSTSTALSINNYGTVVGASFKPVSTPGTNPTRATMWANGVANDLGALGGETSTANGINDSGWVVGEYTVPVTRDQHAWLYRSGRMLDLGSSWTGPSTAAAVNNNGQVAGTMPVHYVQQGTDQLYSHAFIWQDGRVTDLGCPAGTTSSIAMALNDRGEVIGRTWSQAGDIKPFLYTGGRAYLLADLIPRDAGWQLTWATGLNNLGQVVGWGYHGDPSVSRAFLMAPVQTR